jgi:hypothetical protein
MSDTLRFESRPELDLYENLSNLMIIITGIQNFFHPDLEPYGT